MTLHILCMLSYSQVLILFQTRAVVIIYNIPGVSNLNLSLEVAVGIYNGSLTNWRDPLIQVLNPTVQLPDRKIIPIARSDKSGTTSIFTTALSAYSNKWKNTYGTFSQGRQPTSRWNNDAVKFYGYTNATPI